MVRSLADRTFQLCAGLEVREHELEVDGLDVPDRVDGALNVHDIRVVEAADHVEHRVRGADVPEELVPQPFTLAGALHEPCYVDDLDRGRQDLLRFDNAVYLTSAPSLLL